MPTAINILGEFVDTSEPRTLKLKPVDMDKLRAEAMASQLAQMRNARYGIGECEWCHKKFPKNKRRDQQYCCRRCSSHALNAKRDEKRKAELDERNARIVAMRNDGKTQIEIARIEGVSRECVRRVCMKLQGGAR